MKKLLALILALGLVASIGLTASAASDTYEDFETVYNSYKTLYNDTYVPAYDAYKASLQGLADTVSGSTITTQAEFDRLFSFVEYLKETKSTFFGNRTTENKSRYVVPEYREAMYSAVEAKDYASAISYCNQLTAAVQERINLLNSLETEIANFDVVPGDGTIAVATTNVWASSFQFTVTITNTSDTAITNWSASFDVSGATVTNVWANNNGSPSFSASGSTVTIVPQDQWQTCYTIPAGSSVTFYGQANGVAGDVTLSSGSFNGSSAAVTYTVG